MIRFFKSLYLTSRFFQMMLGMAVSFVLAYIFPFLYPIAKVLFFLLVILLVFEIVLLYSRKSALVGRRIMKEKLSNGDYNLITLQLTNKYPYKCFLQIIDEIPEQFQYRDSSWYADINALSDKKIEYQLRPFKRGEYHFGALNVYVSTFIKLVQRRYQFEKDKMVPVYPSIIQMKKYEFAAISNQLHEYGIKKIRKIGHTMEFEQIKGYIRGDDPRTINWKASARANSLMVNTFQDEKSQPVYCVIDKGRLMRFPFGRLSLLDYAINASLVMSNIALKKQDKAGVITFSNKLSSVLLAERKSNQLRRILEVLYNQKTLFKESNFELLANYINRRITHRSLLLCFTNFESINSFNRQLPYFVGLARRHLVVVIFFKNRELEEMTYHDPKEIEGIYTQVIAEQFESDKHLIRKRLRTYGIHSILTHPEDLTVNTINKYLELKARGSF